MRDQETAAQPGEERLSRWHPLDDTFRDWVSGIVASVVVLVGDAVADITDTFALRLLVFWDVMAASYVLLTLLALRSSVQRLRLWAHARSQPVGWMRRVFGGSSNLSQLPSLAAGIGLLASAYVLPKVDELGAEQSGLLTVACAVAVLGGWAVTHLSFALQYAFLYYRSDPAGGLDFPGTPERGSAEFIYFAAAVGTTFGTTDVTVRRSDLRKAVVAHGLVAFVFNTAVLALTLTLLFS